MRRVLGALIGIAVVTPALGTTAATLQRQRTQSPEIGRDGRVTFRLNAPDAARVEVTFAASPAELVRGAGATLGMRSAGGGVWVFSLAGGASGQGSHVLSALATADALAVIPEADDQLRAGAEVEIWWLDRA